MSTRDYTRFFEQADADGTGELTLDELTGALRKAGFRGSDSQLKGMFQAADDSGDKKLNLDEFLVCMGAQPPAQHHSSGMRYVFQQFDTDGNGTINRAELENIWTEMKKEISEEEVEKVMAWFDKDGNDTINYEEFIEYYQSGAM